MSMWGQPLERPVTQIRDTRAVVVVTAMVTTYQPNGGSPPLILVAERLATRPAPALLVPRYAVKTNTVVE